MGKKEVENEKLAAQGAASTGKNAETSEKKSKKDEPKVLFEVKGKCPHCGKKLITKKTKKLLKAAVPAEYEEKIVVEKDAQQTIQESTEEKGPKLDKKKKNKLHG